MELPTTTKNNKNTEEGCKAEEDLENFDEINPNLLKIIEKHQDEITNITNTITVSELIGYVSFLVFLLMLTIRLASNINFNWIILLVPALTCLISFTILLNAYLKLKDLFDELENENFEEEKTNTSLGSILSYFCLNTASLCVLVYLILLSLKLQNIIAINFNEIAIPIFILFGIAVFYYIFIFPAFIKNKLIFPLFMFGLYIIASFIFIVLLNMKLDKNIQGGYYSLVFFSMLISISFQMLCYTYLLVKSNKNNFLNYISIIFALLLLLISLLLTGLKLDSVITIENWVPMVLVIFAYIILVSDKLYALFDKSGGDSNYNNYKSSEQCLSDNSNFDGEKQF
jgi:hypothetical protein